MWLEEIRYSYLKNTEKSYFKNVSRILKLKKKKECLAKYLCNDFSKINSHWIVNFYIFKEQQIKHTIKEIKKYQTLKKIKKNTNVWHVYMANWLVW